MTPSSPSWHPIESAPRDGTFVEIAFRFQQESQVEHKAKWEDNHWITDDDFHFYNVKPTHWRPLPLPAQEPKCPTCGNGVLYHNCGDNFHAPWKRDFHTPSSGTAGSETRRTDAIFKMLAVCWHPETDSEHFHAAREAARNAVEDLEQELAEALNAGAFAVKQNRELSAALTALQSENAGLRAEAGRVGEGR
jgi:hypothetical protein